VSSVVGELLIGIVANGLYDLLRRGLGGSPDQRATATAIAEEALVSLKELPDDIAALDTDAVHAFLSSPEANYVVRQIYASTNLDIPVSDLREEFWRLWCLKTSTPDDELHTAVDELFDSVTCLCERALTNAVAAGNLSALDAKNVRQHRYLRDALDGIKRTLDTLSDSEVLTPTVIENFVTHYRRQVASREGVIVPPAVDAARDFPIDDLYVPPRLTPPQKDEDDLGYKEFASEMYRSVVLGNPGSGKSTLAKKLATDIAGNKVALPTVPPAVVPFLVILRDYGARKTESPCSILDFICSTTTSRYQITPPDGVIEYLLATNRAVVIFDGLDELLDTTYRAEISADVRSFASLYPSVPLMVTSREVGYDQAPLPASAFSTYKLSQFAEGDVHEYARRWFAVGSDVSPEDADETADRFMADSSSVSDLRSNALMLGLMCNLYKGSGYIPRNRPDVYEACADMLFDRWDRLRQIQVGLNIESHIKTSMQHLAFWIYKDPELQSGVTENALIQEAADYLMGRRFDTFEEAEEEARRFIEFCRGRAWVFTDMGTTPDGNRLYQFTHRTFLEFFAARHLARINPTPESLLKVLTPHISAKEWDVVAQLSFQILEKNVEGAADTLLNGLLPTHANPADVGQANRLDFAVRSLRFLVPSPLTSRRLADAALEMALDWAQYCARPEKGRWATSSNDVNPIETVISLLAANPENIGPIRSSLIQGFQRYLHASTNAPYAAELGLNLGHRSKHDALEIDLGTEIEEALLNEEDDTLRGLANHESGIACDLVVLERLSISALLDAHGLGAVFNHRLYWMFPQSGRVPLADLIFGGLLWGAGTDLSLEYLLTSLKEIGASLEETDPPWYRVTDRFFAGSAWGFDHRRSSESHGLESLDHLNSNDRFALVAIGAARAEEAQRLDQSQGPQGLADLIERAPTDSEVWARLSPVFKAKLQLVPVEEGHAALKNLRLPSHGQHLLQRWLDGEVSLVEVDPHSSREPDLQS
jgi:hypothetical protein